MLKITNGVNVFEVTEGAFESIYKVMGYTELKEEIREIDEFEEEEVEELSEEEIFCNEMIEKPIGKWSNAEVKKFAAIKNINIKGTANPTEAKERIQKFLNS